MVVVLDDAAHILPAPKEMPPVALRHNSFVKSPAGVPAVEEEGHNLAGDTERRE